MSVCCVRVVSTYRYSTLFVNDDVFFQSELGWGVLETLGRNWNYRWADLLLALALDSSARTRKKEGRRELRPWLFRCLS